MRECTHCGRPMAEGFCIGQGLEYYCSEECLHEHYSEEEYNEMYESGDAYWTEWEADEIMHVKFVIDDRDGTDDLVAVFMDNYPSEVLECYCHLGQHSTCTREWLDTCTREATYDEYSDLLDELMDIYYDCDVVVDNAYGMDVEGTPIHAGDLVRWTDPAEGYSAEYTVVDGRPDGECIMLSSEYGYCEALPDECVVLQRAEDID